MQIIKRSVMVVLAVALVVAVGFSLSTPASADGTVPGHVLVRLKAGVDANAFAAQYGSVVLDTVPGAGIVSLKVPGKQSVSSFVSLLRKDSRVQWVEADTYLFSGIQAKPNSQYHYAFDFGGDSSTYVNQFAFQQVDLGHANQIATGSGIVVAIIDTGVTFSHPDLQGHLLPGFNVLNPSDLPNDIADGVNNFGRGHGTMVAGLIARLAPNASILPIKALNADGIGTLFDIAKALDFAIANGAKIINMSFGGNTRTSTLNDALDRAEQAGVIMVASAGNAGLKTVQYPAQGKGAVAVAALESDNTKATYSNYGSFIRVCAPGTGIRSTYWDGGYASWSGTSFSAPIVTAAAALVWSVNTTLSANVVKDAIRGTAHSVDTVNPLYKGLLGKGIIDIEAAVKSVK